MSTPDILHESARLHRLVNDVALCIVRARANSAYPKPADRFLEFVLRISDRTKEYLLNELVHVDPLIVQDQVKTLSDVWILLHDIIKPIIDGNALSTPYPLVQFLSHQLERLDGFRGCQVVVGCVSRLNYYQHSDTSLREVLDPLDSLIHCGRLKDRIAFVSLPYSSSRSLFANCLLYHEVGHFVFEILGVSKDVHKKFRPLVKKAFSGIVPGKTLNDDEIKWLTHQLVPWAEELFADILAVRLLGPAYTFVAAELVRLTTLPDPEEVKRFNASHPCDCLRFREQLAALGNDGWDMDVEYSNPRLEYVKDEVAAVPLDDYSACSELNTTMWSKVLSPLASILESNMKIIHDLVAMALAPKLDNPHEHYSCDWKRVSDCLGHGVVPSVTATQGRKGFRAVHPLAVINRAVLFWLNGMPELYSVVKGSDKTNVRDRSKMEERVEMWAAKAVEDWLIMRGRRARDMRLPAASLRQS